MLKITKYLKPFLGLLLIAIVLLFLQAMTDLALPDYMSNIVNTGIQQQGIENSVPKLIKVTDLKKHQIFWSKSDNEKIVGLYDLVGPSDDSYIDFAKVYENLNNEPIYVLGKHTKEDIKEINLPFAKSFLAVEGINRLKETSKDGFLNFNGTKIPANTDLFAMLKMMPDRQKEIFMNKASERFESMGLKMVEQAGASKVKDYYTALGANTSNIQRNYILKTGLIMLVITLIGAISAVSVGYLSSKIAAGVGRNLRKSVFDKVQSFSNNGIDKFSTASLITRSTNDVTQIQTMMVMMIRMVFYAPIMGLGGVIRATSKSTSMSWIIALAVIILLGLIAIVFSIALPKFKMVQKLIDKLNMVTRENLTGLMVIRAFNTQKFEEDRFEEANNDLTKVNLFVNRIMVLLFPAMNLLLNGTMLLIVWVGAKHIAASDMLVGDMMAFMQYAMQIIFSFLMLSMMFIMIPRAAVSAQRISEVLDTKPTILDPENPKDISSKVKGVIEFKHVSFKYPGAEQNMLKDINFKADPGKFTAIIGATGSGKTTLINLIPRLYDVTDGQILLDGVNIKELKQHDLREHIGYVPQKALLFSGTINSNIKYANENATDSEIKKSSSIAQATEFINDKEDNYEASISQGGSNFSGGQKQRLSIARALVKNAKVYLFDDSFSALDFKTDAALRKDLAKETTNKTVIVVAQRISTIKNADQIIVLEDGKMVGIGTHDQLIKNCKEYQEIAYSQLSEEELA